MELLFTGNLYLVCFGEILPPKGNMAVGRVSGLQRTIAEGAALSFCCGIGYNFVMIAFLLAPALPSPFLGSTGGIIFCGWDTN